MKRKSELLLPDKFLVRLMHCVDHIGTYVCANVRRSLSEGFSKLIDRDVILARILPCVKSLTQDSSQHVRSALAKQITGLAPLLGKQHTKEHLLPLFLQLLKDEFSEVRLHLIGKLEVVNDGERDDSTSEP